MDYKEIPVAEAVAGDFVSYFSTGKPSGHVTRKVVGKTRDTKGEWQIRVSWGNDKTEIIPAARIKVCKRPADKQAKMEENAIKETDFRSKLLEGLGIKRG